MFSFPGSKSPCGISALARAYPWNGAPCRSLGYKAQIRDILYTESRIRARNRARNRAWNRAWNRARNRALIKFYYSLGPACI